MNQSNHPEMGRGDRRTAKGKRSVGSYGKSRPHSPAKKPVAPAKSK
jgi:ribosomal small subunit protein bTHX